MRNDDERLKTHIKALIPSTIISEVAAFAILPFWWEISLAPVLLLITILWIAGQNDKQKRFGGTLLLIYGVGLLAVAGIGLLSRPEGWCTLVQGMLLPILLTFGAIPYLQLLIIVDRLQFSLTMKSKTVRLEEYGQYWPLTVDSAKLCYRSGAVWVEANGKKYSLNGFARSVLAAHGYECSELDEIWRNEPEGENSGQSLRTNSHSVRRKVNIGRLLTDGLALECGS